MIRVNDKLYNGSVGYLSGEENADLVVDIFSELTDEDICAIKNASEIEELSEVYGALGEVYATYSIIGWRSVTKMRNEVRFYLQTYRTTDITQLRQDNEDLTAAILELAAIIGGDGNG